MPESEFFVVPVADVPGPHMPESPFCSDPDCPCHSDPELIDALQEQIEDGLLTGAEATRTFYGRQL